MSGGVPAGELRAVVRLSEAYPNLNVPVPGHGEWLDFFIADTEKRRCLYWRLNDGSQGDPDIIEFGFISSHRKLQDAQWKAAWLVREQGRLGLNKANTQSRADP